MVKTENMQNEPLVSIGMPVYNGERFLSQALDSLLKQNFQKFELILVDNASTDGTREICEQYAKRDKRIRYYRNQENIGALKNFDKVLDLAFGKYFMWTAHDDLWEPEFVSTLVTLLEQNEEAILAFCFCDRIDVEGNLVYVHRRYHQVTHSSRIRRSNRYIWFPDGEGRAMFVYGLAKTSAFRDVGGMRKYLLFETADQMLILKLILMGNIVVSKKILFHSRNVPDSCSKSINWGFPQWALSYMEYRTVVLESVIPVWEKIILIISITFHQIIYQLGKPPYRLVLKTYEKLKSKSL